MRPSRLPQTEADFPAWGVYADALLQQGDARGELIAYDLSLPAHPANKQLAQLRKLHRQQPQPLDIGWCLGHARSLSVMPLDRDRPMTKRLMPATVEAQQLHALEQLLDRAPLLESLEVQLMPHQLDAFAASARRLPKTCESLALHLAGDWEQHADKLIDALPVQVSRLRLLAGDPVPFLSAERFSEVDLRQHANLHWGAPVDLIGRVVVAASSRLKLICGSIALAKLTGSEVSLPGDAGLLDPEEELLTVLARPSLTELQRMSGGVVPVRAQLERTLPEEHPVARMFGPTFLRDANGAWSMDGVPLTSGSRLQLPGGERVFLEDASRWRDFTG